MMSTLKMVGYLSIWGWTQTVVRQSGGLTGGKGPGDFSGEECWHGVRFDRTAGCLSQGVGWGYY